MRLNIWLKPKPGSPLQQAWWLHKLWDSLAQRRPRQKQIPIHTTAGEWRWKGTPYHPPDPSQQPHAHPGWKVPFAAWYPRTRRGPPGQRLCDTPAGLHVTGRSPHSPPGSQHGWEGSSGRGGLVLLRDPRCREAAPAPHPPPPRGAGAPCVTVTPPRGRDEPSAGPQCLLVARGARDGAEGRAPRGPAAILRRLRGQRRTPQWVGPPGVWGAGAGCPERRPAPIHRAGSAGWTPVPPLDGQPKVFGCACGLSGVISSDFIFSAQLHLPSKASTDTRSSQRRQHKHLLPAPRGGPPLSPHN